MSGFGVGGRSKAAAGEMRGVMRGSVGTSGERNKAKSTAAARFGCRHGKVLFFFELFFDSFGFLINRWMAAPIGTKFC